MKVSEMSLVNLPPRIIIWGEVGSGKTALALTLGERAQILDFDNGLRTGVSLQDNFTSARLAVDVKQYLEPEPQKRAIAWNASKAYIYGLQTEISSKRFPFDALIIDSLSSFAESAVASIMSNSGKIGQNPEIQHWGLAFTEIKNVLGVLRSLPIVVVLLAHEQVKSIGQGAQREEKLEIAISGKNLPSQVCRYFDEIWYMRAKPSGAGKRDYVLQTVGDGVIPARSRASLPDRINTNIGLWELIKKCGYEPPKKETK